ncbi:MAG: 2Fe-2S iron-sulfur cluster-binding protein, partial [Spirochaetia bacterium]
MNDPAKEQFTITLNGRDVEVQNGRTILEVATQQNVTIPTLCHHESLELFGGCRLCIVEAKMGKRTKMVTACNYEVWEGLEILTDSPRVERNRKMTVELLLSRSPEVDMLKDLAAQYGIKKARFGQTPDDEANGNTTDCILCGLCVRICRERMKASVTDFVGRGVEMVVDTPYHRGSEVCLSCGACEHVCPTGSIRLSTVYPVPPAKRDSEFDLGLTARPSIFIPFSQALPNVPVIDRENCVQFNTGACGICEEVCPTDAIDYGQTDSMTDIEAGAVILAPGFCLYDPSQKPALGYDTFPDVVTSLQFERILSASGPCNGKVVRPSDGKTPDKVAFIQCVGSRDSEHNYCSSVCCMYAIKEAVMAKEHEPDLECEIFYIDIRAHGKGFDEYVERAKNLGIQFTRCRPSRIEEHRSTGKLTIGYVDEDTQEYGENNFGLVVLSAGLEPPADIRELASTFGVELTESGFAGTRPFGPVATSVDGVYVCGPFAEPKDIPETVVEASSAAAAVMVDLASVRGTDVTEQPLPPERSIEGEPPRIGVFVCHCGLNIAGIVDVPGVAAYAARLPNVVYSTDNMYTCASDTQDVLKSVISEHRLNRVIVASCSPRTHEPLFQQTIREAGLNANLFEMANIRDQCSWVHMQDHKAATEKSRDLVRMAVAKANVLEPLGSISLGVTHTAFVLGGGIAGMTAALAIADQDFDVYLVERSSELGGNARNVERTLDGHDVQIYLRGIIARVRNHDRISLYTSAEVEHVEGFVGNFKTKIRVGHQGNGSKPETIELEHGIVIIATGASESKPVEYLYGEDEHVITLQALDEKMSEAAFEVPD